MESSRVTPLPNRGNDLPQETQHFCKKSHHLPQVSRAAWGTAYLKYFIIQNPGAKHDDAIDIYYGVVTAVEELHDLLLTVKDQSDIFLVDTDSNSVPPAKKQIFRRGNVSKSL